MGKSDMYEQGEWGDNLDKIKMDHRSGDAIGIEKDEIHSGHFMISSLDDDAGPVENDVRPGYDFSSAEQETANTYRFGQKVAVEIDTSLTSLFQCMSLAYSGRLTSPKWKNFKGLQVSVKEKVRLNNIIWREWHMQYIQGKKHRICQFENPLTDKTHSRPEAVVLEGKYWKRKLTNVTSEYQRWRMYHKQQRQNLFTSQETLDGSYSDNEIAKSNIFRFGQNKRSECLSPPLDTKTMEEDLMMELSDTLFSSITGPFMFPNPREFGQLGNADIIQPGLVQLQPTMEEFMDTLEPLPPLQEMLSGSKISGSSTATGDSLFSDSQSLFNQPHSNSSCSQFEPGSTSGTASPRLNSSSSLVNPNVVLGNTPESPSFTDLSSPNSSGYASNSTTTSLLSEQPQRFVIDNNPNSITTISSNSSGICIGRSSNNSNNTSTFNQIPQFINNNTNSDNSGFKQTSIGNTQPRPSLTKTNSRGPASLLNLAPSSSPSETSNTCPPTSTPDRGTNSNQSDAAARLLSLILGNNVGGATTQLQQLIASGGNRPQGPDNVLPQQILQLLLQIQQQEKSNQSSDTQTSSFNSASIGGVALGTADGNFDASAKVPSPQTNISEQVIQFLPQVKQDKKINDAATFASPGPTSLFSSTPVKKVKQEKASKVIKYSQLQNLLQGQPVSPVGTATQPVTRIRPETSIVQRQSSQGSLGGVTTKDTPDRRRSKSGDSHLENRRSSTGSVAGTLQKQGRFLIPQSPVHPRGSRSVKSISKQVKIVPSTLINNSNSPSNTVSVATGKNSVAAQNTFLAKLLTGDKPTLIKEEKSQPYPTIRPKPVATKTVTLNTNSVTVSTASNNRAFSMNTYQGNTPLDCNDSDKNGLSELQKGLMIAAAGQSYNVSSSVKLSDLLNNSVTIAQCSNTPVIGNVTETGTSQFQVPSPSESSLDSVRNRSRHSSNESGDSSTPTTFMLEAVKEEQVQSPGRTRRKTELDPVMYKEHRRNCHINAEQKRRYNIKHGFDTLCVLVPTLTQNPNAKVSKAAILQKSAEYCAKLKKEKAEMHKEMDRLKQEIEALTNAIGTCQSQLPATGVPVNRQRANKMKEKFEEYVKQRTLHNWKFWIFSIIVSPLFETYNNSVSTATLEEMFRSVLSWQDQHCSLTILRKVVVESLQKLSTSTDILSEPSKLPEQAIQAVQQQTSSNVEH